MNRDGINLDEISYRGILMDLLKNVWMIILTAAAVWLGCTGVGKLLYQPQYTASSTLVVTVMGSSNAYSSLSTATQMADVFSEVFQSSALRSQIEEDVGGSIEGSISCSLIEETNLLVLSATSPDPRQAYLLINSALQHYEDVSGYVFSNASLEIVQEPSVPSEPSSSSWLIARRNLLALLGAVAMAGIIVLFYLFRFTVKNPLSASRQLDGTIHGVVPFERKREPGARKNSALLLTSPVVSMNFAESLRRAQARIEHDMRSKNKKVLLVTSISENEGKSTTAANIALALAEKRKNVLLIDGDLRKPAQYKIFGGNLQLKGSLENVLRRKQNFADAVTRNTKTGIYQLFQEKAAANPSAILDPALMSQMISYYKNVMDYVIVDCSPTAVAADAELWMQVCDTGVLVVRQDWSDVRAINDTADLIWQTCGDFSGFILNAFHDEWFSGQSAYGYSYKTYGSGSEHGERG